MNLWNLWIQYIEYLCDLFYEKKFWKLTLHILLILFCLFSFTMVVSGILYLLTANWEAITTVAGLSLIHISARLPKTLSCCTAYCTSIP